MNIKLNKECVPDYKNTKWKYSSVESFFLDISKFLVYGLLEFLDLCWMHMTVVEVGNYTLSVVLVFYFHASETTHVDVVTEVSSSCCSLIHIHENIEGLVSLILAVCNALFLVIGLSGIELLINAVFVTFTEQKLRQSVSHQRLPNMFGVFGPV